MKIITKIILLLLLVYSGNASSALYGISDQLYLGDSPYAVCQVWADYWVTKTGDETRVGRITLDPLKCYVDRKPNSVWYIDDKNANIWVHEPCEFGISPEDGTCLPEPVDCTEQQGELFKITGVGIAPDFTCVDECAYETTGSKDTICDRNGNCEFLVIGQKMGAACTGNEGTGGDFDDGEFHNFECPEGQHKEVSKCNSTVTYCVPDGEHLTEGPCEDVDPENPAPVPPVQPDGTGTESTTTEKTTGVDDQGNPTTTITTTTTTTDGNGNTTIERTTETTTTYPDGTEKKKKKKEDTDASGAAYGGCNQTFKCFGDPIQCANAKINYEHRCSMIYTPVSEPESGELIQNGDGVDVSEMIDTDGFLSNRTCPADITVNVLGANHTIALAPLCTLAEWIGLFVVASSLVVGIRIAMGG